MDKEKTRGTLPMMTSDSGGKDLVTLPDQISTPSFWRKNRVAVFATVFAALALAFVWFGFGGAGGSTVVSVETLVPGPIKRVLAVSGRTSTDVSSDIVPSISAQVLAVNVDEGDFVVTGDVLLALDNTTQKSIVRQALAALDSGILKQQAAQTDRDRALALGNTISNVALADSEQVLALAKAEVERLEAALEQAQIALTNYQITAPITGIVLSSPVEAGDRVTPSTVVMRLTNKDNLHVVVQIDEIYGDKIRVGQNAQLQLAGRSEIVTGTVSFVAAEVDELTGSLRVKIAFDTPPNAQIGLTTVANILIDEAPDVLTVPRSAFIDSDTGKAVFVLRDGQADIVPIKYIDWPADRVEITSGLMAGDVIVLTPDGVQNGQSLTTQDDQTGRN